MNFLMTNTAKRDYVQPVFSCIAKMMMIMIGRAGTFVAENRIYFWKFPFKNSLINCLVRSIMKKPTGLLLLCYVFFNCIEPTFFSRRIFFPRFSKHCPAFFRCPIISLRSHNRLPTIFRMEILALTDILASLTQPPITRFFTCVFYKESEGFNHVAF